MNRQEPDPSELAELCSALVDERLTEPQQARLQELLRGSEAARRFYVRFMGLSASLGELAEDARLEQATCAVAATADKAIESGGSWWSWLTPVRLRWALAAAAACAAIVVALASFRPWLREPNQAGMPAVAELTRTASAKWVADANPGRAGAALQPGWLKLESGAAQVTFGNGARVILEGPVEFRLISKTEGFCQAGRLSARVPPAGRGFKIGTPAIMVTDLGTAFGLVASDTRPSEVHVFEGQVEVTLANSTEPAHRLREGEALYIKAGLTKSVPAKPRAFLNEEQFAQRAEQSATLGTEGINPKPRPPAK